MFDTLPISHLATMLAHFSFPMLIAERPNAITEFRTVAMNAALEDIAGPKDAVYGMTLRDVFPQDVVDRIVDAFENSDTSDDIQRFKTVINGMKGEVSCDLTLQFMRCSDGYDRVIATAHREQSHDLDLRDKLAFEDVRYFSFIADLQLENLNSAFVSATEHVKVAPIDEDRIMRLHAVCRTIQRTVSDIKNVVRQAQARHAAHGEAHIIRSQSETKPAKLRQGSHMFDAMSEETDFARQRANQ